MPDLPARWDFAVFRNIFLFELEREKVRSEVWRREKELMQDIRGAIIGGSIFVFSQDNPDQVPSGNLTSIWHSDTPLICTLHTSKWHTDCLIFLFLSRSLLSVSYLSFSSPSSPFLSLWWGFEGCGRASGFDNTDLYRPICSFDQNNLDFPLAYSPFPLQPFPPSFHIGV